MPTLADVLLVTLFRNPVWSDIIECFAFVVEMLMMKIIRTRSITVPNQLIPIDRPSVYVISTLPYLK